MNQRCRKCYRCGTRYREYASSCTTPLCVRGEATRKDAWAGGVPCFAALSSEGAPRRYPLQKGRCTDFLDVMKETAGLAARPAKHFLAVFLPFPRQAAPRLSYPRWRPGRPPSLVRPRRYYSLTKALTPLKAASRGSAGGDPNPVAAWKADTWVNGVLTHRDALKAMRRRQGNRKLRNDTLSSRSSARPTGYAARAGPNAAFSRWSLRAGPCVL